MVSRARRATVAAIAGLVAGTVILGIGGRLVMRALAYAEPAPMQFSWLGTFQVLAAGAAWGALTGPMLLALEGLNARGYWTTGLGFGAVVLVLAALVVGAVLALEGRIVAPPAFIVLSAVLFALLFLAHGVMVDLMVRHWRGSEREPPRSEAAV